MCHIGVSALLTQEPRQPQIQSRIKWQDKSYSILDHRSIDFEELTERQRIRNDVSQKPVAEPVPYPSMLPALFNPSSLTRQPSCPSAQLFSNADHAHAIPSNDVAHDGRESSLVAPNPRAVYFPCRWRAPACPFHQRYRAVC